MDGFITAITTTETGLTAANIWAAITPIAPLVVVLVLVKLGYRMVKGSVESAVNPKSKKVMK